MSQNPTPAPSSTDPPPGPPVSQVESSGHKLWREWILPLVVVLSVMSVMRSAVADWNDVPTGSMKPTIVEGDRIFVNKAAYDLRVPFTSMRLVRWGEPQRGDIVVLFSPADEKRLVKRVVGRPGDTIRMAHGQLLINDEPLNYAPIDPELLADIEPGERAAYEFASEALGDSHHPVMISTWATGRFFGPVTVPADHFFVMGDNRSHSLDSRVFGFVQRDRIVGQATAVVFSHDDWSLRWGRFFTALP